MRASCMLLFLVISLVAVSCTDTVEVRAFDPVSGEVPVYNAICYGPHRDGQRPGVVEPSSEEILEDLRLMAPRWKLIRIYGSSLFAETLLELIRDNDIDIKVMLGVWIAPEEDSAENAAANEREIGAATRLAGEFPGIVVAVSVGNESLVSWSGHRTTLDIVMKYVELVRDGVGVPVTVADDFSFWNKPESRKLASMIDFITMHAHPLWNGKLLEESMGWMKERLAEAASMHPGRRIVIGETGWATSAQAEGEQGELIKGTPGEAEQKEYYASISEWAAEEKLIVFFFEAFDENWKGGEHPDHVEKHWGLFTADRMPKAAIRGR